MFTGSTKLPPTKTPQPERLDEVYAALRRGLQSYLQVHQLELDSLGQQIRENKRNGRLGSLYEQDKQVKAIERFMRRLEFHLSKVEELYDAYCIQRRLRDGASKMVAAFNSATGSKEARESLSEANKGYRECTEHMCSIESEIESQMGEFHVKMKGLAGFARLCAGDQYEVLMRYGRQRWRLRGRVEVSNKQIWDSEEYIFLPLVTELLSIKVTELKSLANHVVVGSVSCEMLDLFCPLPQTLAVDINDLGTVKLNLEVTWSPFDKDDQTSSSSTVSKRLLSNQSPPDTPSMREQVFYSLLRRQGEMENGTVWSNSSESSDDSSSPALAHHAQRLAASNMLPTTLASQLSLTPHKSSASTPSLSSNQEEDETESGEVFTQTEAVPNGHLQPHTEQQRSADCTVTKRASVQSADASDTLADLSCLGSKVSSVAPVTRVDTTHVTQCGVSQVSVPVVEVKDDAPEDLTKPAQQTEAEEHIPKAAGEGQQIETSQAHYEPHPANQESQKLQDAPAVPFPISSSFTQELETALESFDFLNCSDLEDEEDEEQHQEDEEKKKEDDEGKDKEDQHKLMDETLNQQPEVEKDGDDEEDEKKQHSVEDETVEEKRKEDDERKDEKNQNKIEQKTVDEEEKEEEEEKEGQDEDQHNIEEETVEEKEQEEDEGKNQENLSEIKDKTTKEEDKEEEDGRHAETSNKTEEETVQKTDKEDDDGCDEDIREETEDKRAEEQIKEEEEDEQTEPQNDTKEEIVEEEEKKEDETNQNQVEDEAVGKEDEEEDVYSGGSCSGEEGEELEILMEAPEGFRNSDEDHFSDSQESSVEDVQDWLRRIERSEAVEEQSEEKGDEQNGES
ncbi:rho family-interacting cell polarization regulator 2-like [Xyrichtys novacula]|uniref:Rho family-interacting cell polarization regulator 2-like n=1 Tax=Xyrichtys novacula TaxID=13765 RepID=A0AAV1EK89_XYRNO|nr:rho family-interacting cell polarization regulator 2-like [Xyrichtys novacula]